MPERLQRLNIYLLSIIILYVILMGKFLASNTVIHPTVDAFLAFLTSIGFYRLLLIVVYFLISGSKSLLKLYWGRLYLVGLWSYSYVLEGTKGGEAQKTFFGIWRFEQDLFNTKVIGFGLTDDFQERSRVRSVTDLIENRGVYEIVNLRTDSVDPTQNYYSKTGMLFDLNQRGFFKYPTRIRSKTIIYGGKLSGNVHRDVFTKHEGAKSEEEIIAYLKETFGNNKTVVDI